MSDSLIVKTNYGPVKGLSRKSVVGEQYISFRGIPYAKPPIGKLRFKDPQPIEPWTHTLDATKQGPTSMGLDFVSMTLNKGCSEDCLTLNIYTKNLHPRKPYPVMLWIHGGGWRWGDSTENIYGPDYLLEKDVVFVSINYRLGALGFLCIDDPSVEVPGNAGLKDQVLAMRWVRENIKYFGGDDRNITIFGESIGGFSVHLHMISELSQGLFDKAIVQSGSALADIANANQSVNWAERLATVLGWNSQLGQTYFEYLQNVSALDIVTVQDSLMNPMERKLYGGMIFGSTVEPYVAEQSFMAQDPLDVYQNAWGNKIPLIIGGTSEEGLLFRRVMTHNLIMFKDPQIFETIFARLKCGKGTAESREIAEKIQNFYYGDEVPSIANMDTYTDVISDKNFLHGMHMAVKARVNDPDSAATYYYRFNFETKTNFTSMKVVFAHPNIKGACHAEDLEYLFKTSFSKPVVINSIEHKTIDRMVSSWTSFAKTGNPNNEAIAPTYWKAVEKGAPPPYKCLNISDEVTFVDYPEAKRMEFWDQLNYN
ncbi:Esterase B1 [Pseudolycoriella hygida]|uniref:carboxylesterase n=1 Tax=Pseudolycoriella hygida TaxID=35572 RepID=A0A9Q0MXV0_9DIPT|nr:Esterase B1 [Pseudolycoriella hygida]